MHAQNLILVATDFGPCSAAAFREGKRLAGWLGSELEVLHVVTPVPPLIPDAMGFAVAVPLPTDAELITDAKRRWGEFAEACGGAGGARFIVEVGNPREQILESVRRDKPRMLLIGPSSGGHRDRDIGPTAAACSQRAATQVMIVRKDAEGPFTSIVVCVDFEETSRLAIEDAISIASEEGASLHILHVFNDPWRGLGMPEEIARAMPDFADRYREALEARLRKFCDRWSHELSAMRASFHAVQAQSYAEGIMAFIAAQGCDLAVLGTRGRFNLRDYFWGSTAERVVREAKCSVLAIKPQGVGEKSPHRRFADAPAALRGAR
jgi:universal stress protein E